MEQKRLFSYILLILFSILFLTLFIWPKYLQLLELKSKVLELEKNLKSSQEYFKKIEESFSKIKEKKEEVEKIKSALPSDPQVSETFNFLQKAASENGLLLKNISFSFVEPQESKEGFEEGIEGLETPPAPVPPKTKLRELKIKISLSGKYGDLKNFLKKIENSARLIEVENLSLKGKEPFDIDLSLKTFFIPKISHPETEILKLNLQPLENQKLKNLEPFPQIEIPKQEEIGKENPFSP